MLVQFSRLAGRFLAMDIRTLALHAQKGDNDQEPDLGSQTYLFALAHLLRTQFEKEVVPPHIGRNLELHYDWSWADDVALMSKQFQKDGGSINNLTKFVQLQLARITRNPKVTDSLTDPCRLVSWSVQEAGESISQLDLRYKDIAQQKVMQGYGFFKIMVSALDSIIEKHFTFLSPDSADKQLTSLTKIFNQAIHYGDSEDISDIVEKRQQEYSMLPRNFLPRVVSTEWKFTVLKKLITSTQMQLRVVGVTTMCADLLNIYHAGKQVDPATNPLLLYFAQFLLRNELVDYLTGIGSHPEIISESFNIVGFLIVTKTYNSAQTDKIWHTVENSQDPRVVEATVRMLTRSVNLFEYSSLLYLCEKACTVPIGSFTLAMRELCAEVLKCLMQKAGPEGARFVGVPPYTLCVRLMKESSVITPELPSGYPDIQTFAATRFRELLVHGPGADARNAIYLNCIADVAARTPTAPGSICVIYHLLRSNARTDLRILTTDHGLTRLLVEQLESIADDEFHAQHQTVGTSPAVHARRELLLSIILNEPKTLSGELGERLWNVLVGTKAKSLSVRNTSWLILNTAVKKTSPNNEFLESCFRDHLRKLPPQCYTAGSLDFAREAVLTWLDTTRNGFIEEDRGFESPALEQIWHMILTAPPNTIDANAITVLVEVYVDSPLILAIPRAKAREIHLALVDRCLSQLKGAASRLKDFSEGTSSGSDEGMVIVVSEDQFQEQEKTFARSLAVLREFLRAYQSKPQFAPPKSRSLITTKQNAVEGEPLTFRYQSFDGDKHTEVKSLTLGKLNTAATLLASLQEATGFKNYKVYCGGKEFDPDEAVVCKSLEDLNLNGLVLVQRRDDTSGLPSHLTGNTPALETEIMKHFDDLSSYLSMHDSVAREIYYFLIKFPVYDQLLKDFETQTSYTDIFPFGQPYKCLYAIHCLREFINGQSQKGSVSEGALTRAISLIVAAVSNSDILEHCTVGDLRDYLALHLIECLVQFLKEPVPPSAIAPLLNSVLLERLLQLLYDAKEAETSHNSVLLTGRCFEAILEASVHNPELWKSFVSHLHGNTLLRDLILDDDRPSIRKTIAKQIMNKCTFSPSLVQVPSSSFVLAFWPMIAALISEAVHRQDQCEETFTLCYNLFKRLTETSLEPANLERLIKQVGTLLLAHSCKEVVGHFESIDHVAQGLANLLSCAVSFAKASNLPLSVSGLGTNLFKKHLFPLLSEDDDEGTIITPKIPLLNTVIRSTLSDTVFSLVKDNAKEYKNLVLYMSELVPYGTARDEDPYAYELPFQFERHKAIRSSTGYVGLRNLSNTCYLNSLFTQLFMNIPFRQFMLDAHVADGGASQKLLAETQHIFSYMQNSLRRFVDPGNLASSIRTYEETQIDVTIQMDVDEFYNLLFDRWEGQIPPPDAKQIFRSFYGGQLVQQVKSKECPHISERLEPFSAIQCDIKGKSSLEESLQAYVDGEIMEGENKYKCSTCDLHVDAVKRACLKDVPDNLIFHLKRFDFNLRTLQRSKINDHFVFPPKIDMRPYKVENLVDGVDESPEDMFELVGVLVHSGTAESGHYYSFIRERPSSTDKETWVEFNDDSVTPWDPANMEASCFGGLDYRGPIDSGSIPYDKSWSAYMLFYQRSSVVAEQKLALQRSGLTSPVRLSVPTRLSNHIALENEMLMRKHCLYDPSHAVFMSNMLLNIKEINGGHCSQNHNLEKSVLTCALGHLDQVISRTKDLPEYMNFMLIIRQLFHNCVECSRDYLEWFCENPIALRVLLLKNPDALVRGETADSIVTALSKVKHEAAYAYGFDESESEDENPHIIQRFIKAIDFCWENFHISLRGWPEYFGLISSIAKLGRLESALLLDHGYLRKTLDIVSADFNLQINNQYSRMLNIINKRIATRPVSYDAVIEVLWRLNKICDSELEPLEDGDQRFEIAQDEEPIPYIQAEQHTMVQHWTRNNVHILTEKLLHINQNPVATDAIIASLLNFPPLSDNLDPYIHKAIMYGINRRGGASAPCGPFLRAALMYCQHSRNPRAIAMTVTHVSKVASHLDHGDGTDFLTFFKDLFNLSSSHSDVSPDELFKFLLDQIPVWGPGLLTYYETLVRADTEQLLNEVILSHGGELSPGATNEEIEKTRIFAQVAQKLGLACLEHLLETYIKPRQQAVRAQLNQIYSVIDACADFFDYDDGEPQTRLWMQLHECMCSTSNIHHTNYSHCIAVPLSMKKYSVEEIDEEVSGKIKPPSYQRMHP